MYPELMYKRYCLYPQGYTVQHHLCLIEDVSLPLEARQGFLAYRNLLRFHYTWPNAINSIDIKALWPLISKQVSEQWLWAGLVVGQPNIIVPLTYFSASLYYVTCTTNPCQIHTQFLLSRQNQVTVTTIPAAVWYWTFFFLVLSY